MMQDSTISPSNEAMTIAQISFSARKSAANIKKAENAAIQRAEETKQNEIKRVSEIAKCRNPLTSYRNDRNLYTDPICIIQK